MSYTPEQEAIIAKVKDIGGYIYFDVDCDCCVLDSAFDAAELRRIADAMEELRGTKNG